MRQRARRLLKRVATGRMSFLSSIFIAVVFWVVAYVLCPSSGLLPTACAFLLYGLVGYALIAMNNAFAIIRLRSSIQTAAFFVFVAMAVCLHSLTSGLLAVLGFVAVSSILFAGYQRPSPVSSAYLFHAFAVLGICCIFVPKLCWFVPVFWYGAVSFQILKPRSFVASVIGWVLPYVFLGVYAVYAGNPGLLTDALGDIVSVERIDFDGVTQYWAVFAYMTVLFVVTSFHCLVTGMEEKIQTRCYMHYFIVAGLAAIAIMLLQPQTAESVMPVFVAVVCVLSGRFISIADSRMSNFFFVVMLMALLPLFAYNIWMRL